jgi:hypothetical protein
MNSRVIRDIRYTINRIENMIMSKKADEYDLITLSLAKFYLLEFKNELEENKARGKFNYSKS